MEAFVYCWSDMKTNKVYVGMHKGHPEDGYICSSKPMMQEFKQRSNDFVRKIIAMGTISDCRKFENKILKKIIKDPKSCYNKVAGLFIPMTKEIKEKISKTKTGIAGFWLGKKRSEETKKKLSLANIGISRPHTEESRKKLSIAHTGKKQGSPSEETKKKLSDSVKASWNQKRNNLKKEV